jgi:hypothetical protein
VPSLVHAPAKVPKAGLPASVLPGQPAGCPHGDGTGRRHRCPRSARTAAWAQRGRAAAAVEAFGPCPWQLASGHALCNLPPGPARGWAGRDGRQGLAQPGRDGRWRAGRGMAYGGRWPQEPEACQRPSNSPTLACTVSPLQ